MPCGDRYVNHMTTKRPVSLSRNEMKGITGGQYSQILCQYCFYPDGPPTWYTFIPCPGKQPVMEPIGPTGPADVTQNL